MTMKSGDWSESGLEKNCYQEKRVNNIIIILIKTSPWLMKCQSRQQTSALLRPTLTMIIRLKVQIPEFLKESSN